jgi:O-glycosyl hydrolase
VQLLLTSGVGAVFILDYATKGIFVKEEVPLDNEPRFTSDYDELMWLAERQRHHLSNKETRRFFQLRREWTDMHTPLVIGNTLH